MKSILTWTTSKTGPWFWGGGVVKIRVKVLTMPKKKEEEGNQKPQDM